MSPSSSMYSRSSSNSKASSNASSIRHALELQGYDSSLIQAQLIQEQDAANERAETKRLADKAAFRASIERRRNRLKWFLIKNLHIDKRPAAIAYEIPQSSLDNRKQVYVSESMPAEARHRFEYWDSWEALLSEGPCM